MDNLMYQTMYNYFNRVSYTGNISNKSVYNILTLIFIYLFKKNHCLNSDDEMIIDRAVNCIKGQDCLIP